MVKANLNKPVTLVGNRSALTTKEFLGCLNNDDVPGHISKQYVGTTLYSGKDHSFPMWAVMGGELFLLAQPTEWPDDDAFIEGIVIR